MLPKDRGAGANLLPNKISRMPDKRSYDKWNSPFLNVIKHVTDEGYSHQFSHGCS
jgi:hypothetical protein